MTVSLALGEDGGLTSSSIEIQVRAGGNCDGIRGEGGGLDMVRDLGLD